MRRALIRIVTVLVLFLTALAGGYLLSSGLAQEALRVEVETQLARVLRGPVSIESVRLIPGLGLAVEGRNIEVYPDPDGPGLSAEWARVEIDLLSLLLGRIRLDELWVEGAHLRIVRRADGSWFPYPMAALGRGSGDGAPDPEPALFLVRACERVTRELVEDALVADHLEVRRSRVSWTDHRTRSGRPLRMGVEAINGTLDHRFFSDAPELALRATFRGDDGAAIPIEAEGRRQGDVLRLTLSATGLPLGGFETYVREALGPEAALAGELSGVVAYQTGDPGTGFLEIDWIARNLAVAVPLGNGRIPVESAQAAIQARLELHPSRLRLRQARFDGEQARLRLSGVIERPLRDVSRARLETEILGAPFAVVEHFVDALPASDRDALEQIFEEVQSGEIVRIGGSGTTSISEWRRLLDGELSTLPRGFVLGAEIRDVSLSTAGRDRLTDVAGTLAWSRDRISIESTSARWNDTVLPELSFQIVGVSHLFKGPQRERLVREGAQPLPGLVPLGELLRGEEGSDAGIGFPTVRLEILELHHTVSRFPLVESRLSIRPTERGLEVDIHDGTWGGAPISGEAVWVRGPEPRIRLSVKVGPPRARSAPPGPPPSAESGAAPWMRGRFEVDPLRDSPAAFHTLTGSFAVEGSTVYLSDVNAELDPVGTLTGHLRVDLSSPDDLGIALAIEIEEGDLSRLGGLFGLPDGIAQGTVGLTGSLEGPLRPGSPPLSGLEGFVSVRARDGQIRQRLPLLAAVAQATEGFNPLSERESVAFESIDADLEFSKGRISTKDLRLEGPVRVFVTGELDVASDPETIDAVAGVFLFRQADRTLGRIPLVNVLFSDKGMVGAYYAIRGPLAEPEVDSLAVRSIVEGIPDVVKSPFKVLKILSQVGRGEAKRDEP
ncbi:MAG: hypothetical protein O7G30_08620 [Proteobacteria bacterium]|nr:hypothetical protein [Pseudomonadota bacterium]